MERTKIEIIYGDESFIFPITPQSFNRPTGVENTTVTVNGQGEVNLKGKKILESVSWSCFFPREYPEYAQVPEAEFKDATEYRDILKELEYNNETITLNITDFISMIGTIESFEDSQEDGSGDIFYSITIKEQPEINTPDSKKQTAKRPVKTVKSHMYKWKKGDTWKKVAKKETGKSSNWSKIKKDNKSRITKAVKAYKKKHPRVKKVKDTTALIGTKILIK